jgi:hypothetical protein
MKTRLATLLLTLTTITAAPQRQGCLLHIVTHSKYPPQSLTLLQPPSAHATATTFPFTDSSVILLDSIDNPLVITLLITYQGAPKQYRYPVFLMPGELFVQLNEDEEDNREYVEGPPLSHEFTAMLEQPVAHYNHQLGKLKNQLDSARLVKGDTQTIKNEIAGTVHQCWDVPREYVRANPACLLSLIALEMMGNGDPTVKNPAGELEVLFKSLDPALKSSSAGKKYAVRLTALRQGLNPPAGSLSAGSQ